MFHFDFLLFFSVKICLPLVFFVFSCPPIVFPSSLSFHFRNSAWPVLYSSLIVKQLCWQQMFGALQLGENEPTPIFRDPLVFTQYCLTVLTALPSVLQVWDSRTLSSPCTCHRSTGGYRLGGKSVIQTIGWSWGKLNNLLWSREDSMLQSHLQLLFTHLLSNFRRSLMYVNIWDLYLSHF